MAIEIGNYITPQLKEYINIFVDVDERKKLSREFNFDMGYERLILGGTKPITAETKPYFIELVKKAVRNRTKKLPLLNQTHKELVKDIA